MNLTQELQNFRNQFQGNVPTAVQSKMAQATQYLVDSEISQKAIQTGDRAPNFTLPNALGKSVELQALLQSNVVVLAFYRGQWCPYCNLELRALQNYLPKIQALGATLVAISPQTPDHSLSTAEKHELTFEVLSDAGNQVAKQFGLVFTLSEDLRPIYEDFGIDLPAHNGDQTFELPIPATYVVDRTGTVVHAFVNPDYTQRLDPEELISILEKLAPNS
ncbi:MAG: AhpC/TSA family protein [Oscillatoriales cyanobacterium RM1_1_9]|nr:AhpC/TSA family protein [Oscillatoriales cyanobacterium SM2_3_0]NJO45190.1 AhpC/TSA family protein [Oscillatoriales cyanobacterium RM2_1_1]NJO71248.1 AhpC/TSA family protein [Oscillatoriales cyanobacterium RM1_1_9]